MAPAKSKKLSMAPIRTSVKSIVEINVEKELMVFGKRLGPNKRNRIETTMAISITPMVAGNFRNLKLR